MNVLSLFDGISCGRVALERAQIPVSSYYASEIDRYAIQISLKNHPDIVQLGNIENWNKWDIPQPDLIIGGSPCQGFSFAGKQLAFDDPRSKLFFTFVEILKHYKPKYFLLENVRMKKEYIKVISEQLEVEPICINSSLVSAQNRVRYYWTNIRNVKQPHDKHIYLKDIIEHGTVDKDKSYCIDSNYWKGGNLTQYFEKHRRQLVFNHCDQNGYLEKKGHQSNNRIYSDRGKSPTLITPTGGGKQVKVLYQSKTENFVIRKLTPIECERLQTLPDNYTEGVSNTQRYKALGNAWTIDVISHILSSLK